MCGIVGYMGHQDAYQILIKGLKRLEYRGYDSAGIALINDYKFLNYYKKAGKVIDLENHAELHDISGKMGIGHTRWATHGEPNDTNAHPHMTYNNRIAIVHNGIIENYAVIKEELQTKYDYKFSSDTDTEVLGNLIELILLKDNVTLEDAVRLALNQVEGAYAILVLDNENPDKMVVARKGSPMVIGIGDNEFFIASDASPIVEFTKNVIYLDDEEYAIIERDKELIIKNLENNLITPFVQELQMDLEEIEKGQYEHFMLKEIFEQPKVYIDAIRGRINAAEGWIKMGGVSEYQNRIINAKRFIIIACGTSYHSGLLAEYLIEDLARVPVEVEYASEFRYRNPIINEDDVVIAISQSGETADTLAAMDLARSKGALIFGICNVIGSSIARQSHAGSYTHAGPEIGVASTKAFTNQLIILTLLSLQIAQNKGRISESEMRRKLFEIEQLPKKMQEVLELADDVKAIAEQLKDATNMLYLGRGYNFPVALEGALKLKEISYIHAEGYPAAEMKHGPIALIDEQMPIICLATNSSAREKIVSNIQEVKARKGKILSIVTKGDETIKALSDYCIEIPEADEILIPILTNIPLQLLAYHIAVLRGVNVDQPRNLAKSVTVE